MIRAALSHLIHTISDPNPSVLKKGKNVGNGLLTKNIPTKKRKNKSKKGCRH
jgi:hypothetical protein